MSQSDDQAFGPLNAYEQDFAVALLPEPIKTTLAAYTQLFIGGGFLRAARARAIPKDIDIFTTDLSIIPQAVEFFIRQCNMNIMTEKATPCTITVEGLRYPIQFINNKAYASPEECLRQFDFTICQAALWRNGQEWHSLCSPEFSRDVALRRLVYTNPVREEAPGGSLWRAIKFAERGYHLTQEELAKLVVRLNRQTMKFKYVEDDEVLTVEYDDEAHHEMVQKSFVMYGGGTY